MFSFTVIFVVQEAMEEIIRLKLLILLSFKCFLLFTVFLLAEFSIIIEFFSPRLLFSQSSCINFIFFVTTTSAI